MNGATIMESPFNKFRNLVVGLMGYPPSMIIGGETIVRESFCLIGELAYSG